MSGRVPVGIGSGPGLTPMRPGQKGGQETISVAPADVRAHRHRVRKTLSGHVNAIVAGKIASSPGNAALAPAKGAYRTGSPRVKMQEGTVTVDLDVETFPTGKKGNLIVPVRDPFIALRYCIAIEGLYPSRN